MAPPLDGLLRSTDKISLAGPIDDLNSRRSWNRKNFIRCTHGHESRSFREDPNAWKQFGSETTGH